MSDQRTLTISIRSGSLTVTDSISYEEVLPLDAVTERVEELDTRIRIALGCLTRKLRGLSPEGFNPHTDTWGGA